VPEGKQSISAEGRAKAEEELRQLRDVRRPEIVAAIKAARAHGDLSENAEYHAAREEQGLNEARIRALEHHLANSEVAEAATGGAAGVGSVVRYRDASRDTEAEVTLVHRLEASVSDGKISIDSPLGQALAGRTGGETVTLRAPQGERQLEVLEVS
jgi:transcription elongation factor GreA